MRRNELADILASCLDSMERGERTVEECLALFPEHRDDIEPLLRTTAFIRERADFRPHPGFHPASRARLLRRLTPRTSATVGYPIRHARRNAPPVFSRRVALLWMVIFVSTVSLFASGTVYASSNALPGEFLYPVKLSVEDARLLISDDVEDVLLSAEFVQARVDEIQALIDNNREEDLDLAVNLLVERIHTSTEALAAVAEDNPEHAAQLSSLLEATLSSHTEILTSQLGNVPDQAKPAIERAISASTRGQEVLQRLFENRLPGGPPDDLPAPARTQPAGPPNEIPAADLTRPAGGPSEDITDPASTQPGAGPPHGTAGPPNGVPGNRP